MDHVESLTFILDVEVLTLFEGSLVILHLDLFNLSIIIPQIIVINASHNC